MLCTCGKPCDEPGADSCNACFADADARSQSLAKMADIVRLHYPEYPK